MGFKWFVLATAVAACGNSSQPKSPPVKKDAAVSAEPHPSRVVALTHIDEPVIVLPKQESFTLLAPGTGAKSALRYQLAAASSESHGETKLESRRLSGGTWGPVVKLPPISDGFVIMVEADRKRPVGFRALVGTITGTQTPDVEQYLATWRTIEKRLFGVVFDDRGQLGEITFADDPAMTRSAEAKDELVQRLLATVIPLPDEPVGIGAKWRVVTILRQRPAIVKQSATYTLTARDKVHWQIGVELQRVGDPQVVTDPGLPKGAAANILALVRKLHGTVDVDPTRALPVGTLAVESTLHARIALPGLDPAKDPSRVEELVLDDHGTVKLTAK